MGYFDEQIKKKNRLEHELFEESYQRLASVVTGSGTWEGFGSSVLLTRSMMDEIAAYLDVGISIPCFPNEEYTARFYMDKYLVKVSKGYFAVTRSGTRRTLTDQSNKELRSNEVCHEDR